MDYKQRIEGLKTIHAVNREQILLSLEGKLGTQRETWRNTVDMPQETFYVLANVIDPIGA